MGTSPRMLILSIMVGTAFLSMWVSNTATTAMMAPIALGLLSQIIGRSHVQKTDSSPASFTNIQISFTDWFLIGFPMVVLSLPVVWYILTVVMFPPQIESVEQAREEGELSNKGRWVARIFIGTALLWVFGGFGFLFKGIIPPIWHTTIFGGSGSSLFGPGGHQGLLYYVMVGLYAIPALILTGSADWDDLVDINWGTILLFGGGLSLANALTKTGATKWFAQSIFNTMVGAPMFVLLGAVIFLVIWLTNVTSNTATTAILAPVLITLGGSLAASFGLSETSTAVVLAVSAAVAASHAFVLPVVTPPNAIVFGTDRVKQNHMLQAGIVLNILMTILLTIAITFLFHFFWPLFLW